MSEDNTATAAWNELAARYEERLIPYGLLDPPEEAERETMEEGELADLALSIAEIGLIKPLVVVPRGDRFEIVAGHRRFLACGIANMEAVPCRVKVGGDVDTDAIKVAENAHVEAVNPIEEARFYQRLLTKSCNNDVDLLCLKVRRRRSYVEDRLLLLRGNPRVIEALHQKQISIAVARELNKINDPNRLLILLDTSVQQGATARQVAEWRRNADMMGPVQVADSDPNDQANNPAAIAPESTLKCWFCDSEKFPSMMEFVY